MKKLYLTLIAIVATISSFGQTLTYDDLFITTCGVLEEKLYHIGDTTTQSGVTGLSNRKERANINVISITSFDLTMMFVQISMGDFLAGTLGTGMIEYSELRKMIEEIEKTQNSPVKFGNAANITTWFMTKNHTIIKRIASQSSNSTTWEVDLNKNQYLINDIQPILIKLKQALALMDELKK